MMMKQGIRKGIKGIAKFLTDNDNVSNWHIFTRHDENGEYAYVTFNSMTLHHILEDYLSWGWTFDDFSGNGLYFTENNNA